MSGKEECMNTYRKGKAYEVTEIAMFVVILIICSWISIPTVIPFTMQTFAIFLAICVLGGKKTSMVVFIYLLMGSIGLPVFSGFCGGAGCLVGNTGGFLVGFFIASLVIWGLEHIVGLNSWIRWIQMTVCIMICYFIGVVWYMAITQIPFYSETVMPIISVYVLPFVIPDGIKMILAYYLSKRIKIIIKNSYC